MVFRVGPIGQAPDKMPLILDSHDDGMKDAMGQSIPDGVQLRPFCEQSWYFHSTSHALRFLPGGMMARRGSRYPTHALPRPRAVLAAVVPAARLVLPLPRAAVPDRPAKCCGSTLPYKVAGAP